MRRLLLLYACISSLAASAAIITERNDVALYAPEHVKFVGTSSYPGIASEWIPYGTYTSGTGGVEYLRVTSKLAGVVASVLDGLWEREYVVNGYYSSPDEASWRYVLHAAESDLYSEDHGEFLAAATTNSQRIAEILNAERILMCYNHGDGTFSYGNSSRGIESSLAYSDLWYNVYDGYLCEREGLAMSFGSRALDELVASGGGSTAPPISTNWTAALPFREADSNLWAAVWPTYGAVSNDLHFYVCPSNYHFCGYLYPAFDIMYVDRDIWGYDVMGYDGYDETLNRGAAYDLMEALSRKPIPCNLEDVLSVDTGWTYAVETNVVWHLSCPLGYADLSLTGEGEGYKVYDGTIVKDGLTYSASVVVGTGSTIISIVQGYTSIIFLDDLPPGLTEYWVGANNEYHFYSERVISGDDYVHWRNGTTRLDWKRLGIICQIERQMEQTYRRSDNEDYLPFQEVHAHHGKSGTTPILKSLPVPNRWGQSEYVSLSNVTWTLTESRSSSTNEIGWSYPTVRTPKPSFSYGADVGGVDCGGLTITWGDFTNSIYEALGSHDAHSGSIYTHPIIHLEDEPLGVGVVFWIINSTSSVGDFGFFWSAQDLFPDASATNYELSVRCDIGKSAHVRYTTSREDQERAILERLDPHPNTNTWNRSYVARQTRPTLEIMIAAAGDHARADVGGDDLFDPLPWDAIKDISVSERFFRMNPLCAEATTKSASDYNRLEMLRNLDIEIKDKCVELGGLDVSMAHHVADMKPEEEAAMIRGAQTAGAYLEFGVTYDEKFIGMDSTNSYLNVNYEIDGHGNLVLWEVSALTTNGEYRIDSDTPIHIGSYGWREASHPGSVPSYTGRYENVRVDAHQNQMIKTLWKFKNLRDPNL